MNNSINYFPNVIELTFGQYYDALHHLTAIAFNYIFPLSQLTKPTIECRFLPFKQLMNLLCSTPNMHTIKVRFMTDQGYRI